MTDLYERAKAALDGASQADKFDLADMAPDLARVLIAETERRKRIEAAAVKLADRVEQRMNDLGGYDDRFSVRQALAAFRAAMRDTDND